MKTILILSGGMDSSTLLYKLLNEGHEIKALSFDYGQRHKIELKKAKELCDKLGVSHKIVDLTSITSLISNSSLTSDKAVPEGHYEDQTMKQTVVPNRNMIMASIAIGYAVNEEFDGVALGVHAGDHAIYPDCRPEFIRELRFIARIANYRPINIITPFLFNSKGDIARIGEELNVDFSLTHTCYKGGEEPCMKCGSCREREEAFNQIGIKDPLCK